MACSDKLYKLSKKDRRNIEIMESYAKEHALRFADHCLKHPDWEKEDEEIYMEWAEKLTAKENFLTRLKEFIEDVQVNDPASEEEKAMIVHVCNEFTKKQGGSEQQKCVECGKPMQKKEIIIKGDEDTCDECLCPE